MAATYTHEEVYWENKNILQEIVKEKLFSLGKSNMFKFIEKLFSNYHVKQQTSAKEIF